MCLQLTRRRSVSSRSPPTSNVIPAPKPPPSSSGTFVERTHPSPKHSFPPKVGGSGGCSAGGCPSAPSAGGAGTVGVGPQPKQPLSPSTVTSTGSTTRGVGLGNRSGGSCESQAGSFGGQIAEEGLGVASSRGTYGDRYSARGFSSSASRRVRRSLSLTPACENFQPRRRRSVSSKSPPMTSVAPSPSQPRSSSGTLGEPPAWLGAWPAPWPPEAPGSSGHGTPPQQFGLSGLHSAEAGVDIASRRMMAIAPRRTSLVIRPPAADQSFIEVSMLVARHPTRQTRTSCLDPPVTLSCRAHG